MTESVVVAELDTVIGVLVSAVATFGSVRSAYRVAWAAEQGLLEYAEDPGSVGPRRAHGPADPA